MKTLIVRCLILMCFSVVSAHNQSKGISNSHDKHSATEAVVTNQFIDGLFESIDCEAICRKEKQILEGKKNCLESCKGKICNIKQLSLL